jgi:hypothetical protein
VDHFLLQRFERKNALITIGMRLYSKHVCAVLIIVFSLHTAIANADGKKESDPGFKEMSRDLTESEKAARKKRVEVNYTTVTEAMGYECFRPMDSNSTKDVLLVFRVETTEEADTLGENAFECSPALITTERLNCDVTKEPEWSFCREGKADAFSPSRAFSGKADCNKLIATMNWLHKEAKDEWDTKCESRFKDKSRELADSDAYPDSCTGSWYNCVWNVHTSGIAQWWPTTSDQWFHLHAHNIQGNQVG